MPRRHILAQGESRSFCSADEATSGILCSELGALTPERHGQIGATQAGVQRQATKTECLLWKDINSQNTKGEKYKR